MQVHDCMLSRKLLHVYNLFVVIIHVIHAKYVATLVGGNPFNATESKVMDVRRKMSTYMGEGIIIEGDLSNQVHGC